MWRDTGLRYTPKLFTLFFSNSHMPFKGFEPTDFPHPCGSCPEEFREGDTGPETFFNSLRVNFVIPLGFEPRTHTLKVYCSTSWATESVRFISIWPCFLISQCRNWTANLWFWILNAKNQPNLSCKSFPIFWTTTTKCSFSSRCAKIVDCRLLVFPKKLQGGHGDLWGQL